MKQLRGIIFIVAIAVISFGIASAIEALWPIGEPSCDGQVMQVADVCTHSTGGASNSYSYSHSSTPTAAIVIFMYGSARLL